MLKDAFTSLPKAYKLILTDKICFALAIIPLLLGIALYYYFGQMVFGIMMSQGQGLIDNYLGDGKTGEVISWIIKIILTILFYYIANLTFVLIVSIIASPFNDLLSGRVEKLVLKQELPNFSESVSHALKKIIMTISTELKKIIMILILSVIAVVLGFFPLFTPLSVLLGAILLACEFLDFSWSRSSLSFSDCKKDYKRNFLAYTLGGGLLMMIVSIPVVNLIVPAFGTSYFTVMWVKNNESRH